MKTQLVNHFSVFGYGYRNRDGKAVLAVKPEGIATVTNIYQYITSESARHATRTLREMAEQGATRDELSDYKKLSFKIATQPSRVHSVIVMPIALSTTRLIWLSISTTWHPRPKPDS